MIPVAGTTITVVRTVQPEDAYQESTEETIATLVRAVIAEPSRGSARDRTEIGDLGLFTRRLTADVTDLRDGDMVIDDQTGATYEVASADIYSGLIPHSTATLVKVGYQ